MAWRCCFASSCRLYGLQPTKKVAGRGVWIRRLATVGERGGGGRLSGARLVWLYVIPVSTFCLGTWQVYRLQWKKGLIADLERRTMQPTIDIPANVLERLDELEYHRVRLHGHFDHSRELYVWPRTLISDDRDGGRGRGGGGGGGMHGIGGRGPQPGAFVITPFYCQETNCQILVNRGWVPRLQMNPATRSQGQIEGDLTLMAIVRKTEKRMPFAPHNNASNNHWNNRDVDAMAQEAGTEPIFVDADSTSTVPGGPIGGQTRVYMRNEHLQYIITWYGLSLATSYLARQFLKGKNMFR